jgi:hypothetical protein
MKKNSLKLILVLSLGFLQLCLLPSCAVKRGGVTVGSPAPPSPKKSGPPPWAPAHGHRAKYRYRYYPNHYVYYDVERRVYFYIEGEGWRVSAQLPRSIHIEYADYVTIEMETGKPYEYFYAHKKAYPPGQAKKNKKHKKG